MTERIAEVPRQAMKGVLTVFNLILDVFWPQGMLQGWLGL